jgi:hypothetical protein
MTAAAHSHVRWLHRSVGRTKERTDGRTEGGDTIDFWLLLLLMMRVPRKQELISCVCVCVCSSEAYNNNNNNNSSSSSSISFSSSNNFSSGKLGKCSKLYNNIMEEAAAAALFQICLRALEGKEEAQAVG